MATPAYVVHTSNALPGYAAGKLEAAVRRAVRARGEAHVALSGGSTPRALFGLLAERAWQQRIPWHRVHIWWVDERCVPPDHHESNYGSAYVLLLQHLAVTQVHRMRGELADPVAAAQDYEAELRELFGLGAQGRPRFDFVLLGMGGDGHTASLFPGTPALAERRRLVTVGQAPTPPHQRLTLTLPVLNRAAFVLFMAAGAGKGEALRQIFLSDPAGGSDINVAVQLPAAQVRPTRGRLLWLLDEIAATDAGLAFG